MSITKVIILKTSVWNTRLCIIGLLSGQSNRYWLPSYVHPGIIFEQSLVPNIEFSLQGSFPQLLKTNSQVLPHYPGDLFPLNKLSYAKTLALCRSRVFAFVSCPGRECRALRYGKIGVQQIRRCSGRPGCDRLGYGSEA